MLRSFGLKAEHLFVTESSAKPKHTKLVENGSKLG